MVWYSHVLQNFPQFIVTDPVKGFGIVNKAEMDVFWELLCFFDDPADVGNLISGSPAFSKSIFEHLEVLVSYTIEESKFLFTWRVLSVTLLACEMSEIVQ